MDVHCTVELCLSLPSSSFSLSLPLLTELNLHPFSWSLPAQLCVYGRLCTDIFLCVFRVCVKRGDWAVVCMVFLREGEE